MHLVGFLLTFNYDTRNHEFKIKKEMKSINYWQSDTDEKTEILGGKTVANMYVKGRAVSVERGRTYSKQRL